MISTDLEVILRVNGKEIDIPSLEQLDGAIKLLEITREKSRELLESGARGGQDSTCDVGRESMGISFEEPAEAFLQAALDDIESRVGLSDDEYAKKYNLKNVNVDFSAFEDRLRAAPIEKRAKIVEAHLRGDNLVLFCQKQIFPPQADPPLAGRE